MLNCPNDVHGRGWILSESGLLVKIHQDVLRRVLDKQCHTRLKFHHRVNQEPFNLLVIQRPEDSPVGNSSFSKKKMSHVRSFYPRLLYLISPFSSGTVSPSLSGGGGCLSWSCCQSVKSLCNSQSNPSIPSAKSTSFQQPFIPLAHPVRGSQKTLTWAAAKINLLKGRLTISPRRHWIKDVFTNVHNESIKAVF